MPVRRDKLLATYTAPKTKLETPLPIAPGNAKPSGPIFAGGSEGRGQRKANDTSKELCTHKCLVKQDSNSG